MISIALNLWAFFYIASIVLTVGAVALYLVCVLVGGLLALINGTPAFLKAAYAPKPVETEATKAAAKKAALRYESMILSGLRPGQDDFNW